MNSKKWEGDFLMLITTIFWGGGSIFSKQLLAELDIFMVLALRFLSGFLVCFIVLNKRMKNIKKTTIINSIVLGGLLFFSYLTMMFGVRITSASNSGFIMSLSVVFVPIILFIFENKTVCIREIVSIIITVAGVTFLCFQKNKIFNQGDFWTLVCAIIYAIHIIIMEKKVKEDNPVQLGTFQLLWVGIICLVLSIFCGNIGVPVTTQGWFGLFYLGVLCTGCGFLFQSIAQTKTNSTHISLIYATLPAFVAVFARIVYGEMLSIKRILGIIIMILGIALMEVDIEKLWKKDIKSEQ